MRPPRQKLDPNQFEAFYHLISRSVSGDRRLGKVEREFLRRQIWRIAERLGLVIITFTIMSNHLHIIVRAPKSVPLSDAELLRRYAILHSGESKWEEMSVRRVHAMLAEGGPEAAQWRAAEMKKMSNISEYMKLLKQRFSIWYNREHSHFGTTWAGRFTSVLLESGWAVLACAAYVDLNAFRAGLCRDPKDYRFSGYAEAVAGNLKSQAGIIAATAMENWEEASRKYRMVLILGMGRSREKPGQVLSQEELAEALATEGKIPLAELLSCRCRFLTDSLVLGSQAFVQEQLDRYRAQTGRGERMRPRSYVKLGTALTTLVRLRGEEAPI